MLPAGPASVDMAGVTLGLRGFVVLAASEYGGELELLVETTESVTDCPRCGVMARLLDVVEGRSGQVVSDWLDERGPDWCNDVRVAALDPFRG